MNEHGMQSDVKVNEIEKVEVIEKGFNWYKEHEDHVHDLIKDTEISVKPSGSDLLKPELWKDIHWNWFFEEIGRIFNTFYETK